MAAWEAGTVAAWPTASSIGSSTSTGIDRNVP